MNIENMAVNIIIDDSNPHFPVFMKIETDAGESIRIGEYLTSESGYSKIRITRGDILQHLKI